MINTVINTLINSYINEDIGRSLWEPINRPSHPMYDLLWKKKSYLSLHLASLLSLTLFPYLGKFSYFLVYKRGYLLWIIIQQHFQYIEA